jgi:phage terminase large subunit-like protein
MLQPFSRPQIKARIVSALVITVAPFQWRHNAQCTTFAVQTQHPDATAGSIFSFTHEFDTTRELREFAAGEVAVLDWQTSVCQS